jgi:anti-sigma-K factor RskA
MTEHPTDDLGLYALGLLDEDERRSIAQHLATCAACRAELATYEATVAALGEGVAASTSTTARDAIVARHRRRWAIGRPAFASVASLVLLGALIASLAALVQERTARDDYGRALAAVAAGGRVIAMQGATGARGAIVVSREGPSYLVLELPAPPSGKAYEAWVIRDGAPRPAGMAPVLTGVITIPVLDALRDGDVAAITLEDQAGVQLPTSDPLLLGRI